MLVCYFDVLVLSCWRGGGFAAFLRVGSATPGLVAYGVSYANLLLVPLFLMITFYIPIILKKSFQEWFAHPPQPTTNHGYFFQKLHPRALQEIPERAQGAYRFFNAFLDRCWLLLATQLGTQHPSKTNAFPYLSQFLIDSDSQL